MPGTKCGWNGKGEDMKQQSKVSKLQLQIILAFSVLLISLGVAFGQGDEDRDTSGQAEATAVDTLPPAPDARKDSIYAEIERGFVTLKPIFKKGCFDCHSTQTDYPWYYKIPGVKGMIDNDIKHARHHVDFTDGFPFTGRHVGADALAGISEELKEGEMPPLEYRMMHWSAKPSDAERDSVLAWVQNGLDSLATIGIKPSEDDD